MALHGFTKGKSTVTALTRLVEVKMIKEKANKIIKSLMSILPKVGGSSSSTRALLRSAVISTITYAAPVWTNAIKHKKYVFGIRKAD